jgi:hypothetical protein
MTDGSNQRRGEPNPKEAEAERGRRDDILREWRGRLTVAVTGLMVFESVTGVFIYALPFSIPVQFAVLLHTAVGVLAVFPFVWYQTRHYLAVRRLSLTSTKFLGYGAFASLTVCGISGVAVTIQGVWGARLSYTWDLIHTVSGFVGLAVLLAHIGTIIRAHRAASAPDPLISAAQRVFVRDVLTVTLCLAGLTGLAIYAYSPVRLRNELPPDYSWKYGRNPFSPSLAMTTTGGAFDPRSLGESESCGTAGCHEQIVEEWLPSAHRYASMDKGFQAIQATMAANNGPESTRYCGGCHDPISLFSGSKTVYTDELSQAHGYREGVSCIVCHSIVQTDVKGNANYVMAQPVRYIYELQPGATAKFLSDFLIRAYPEHHKRSFARSLYRTAEFCGACHKQFIDKEINNVGWVQLQNQYDNWRKSRWNHPDDPKRTLTCRECHMRLTDSTDPAAGDAADFNRDPGDGKHRNHRFIGANQYMPALHRLPGADVQIALTEQWLRGETALPEIADRWTTGPAVPIRLVVSPRVAPDEEVSVKVEVTNNKVGHDFPTGPLDIIQAWVELVVTDEDGRVVYESGTLNDRHFIREGSFIFKAEGIDQYGNLIDRHNLWEMIGVRFRRSLFPGFSDVAEYRFLCPATIRLPAAGLQPEYAYRFRAPRTGTLQVSARLRYRKIDQFLMNTMFGEHAGLTTRVTDISHDAAVIQVGG